MAALAALALATAVGGASTASASVPGFGAPPSAPGPDTGPLSRAGRWMVDDESRVVIVHGVNIVHKVAPYYPNAFTAQDAEFLPTRGSRRPGSGSSGRRSSPSPASTTTHTSRT